MKMSFYQALKNVGNYIIGRNNNNVSNIDENIVSYNDYTCRKCDNQMKLLTAIINDFHKTYIYECENCKTISERTYTLDDKLTRETHLYGNKEYDTMSYAELIKDINTSTFCTDKLYEIDNFLCYPVIFYNDFFNTLDVIFVKIDDKLYYNELHGFVIHNNVTGYVNIEKQNDVAYYHNPYLGNLPHTNWKYTPMKQNINDVLKPVTNIRFDYTIEVRDQNINLHKLSIILDLPIKCIGIGINISFFSRHIDKKLKDIIKDLDLKNIIISNSTLNINESYTLQSFSIVKYSLSSISYNNISIELKNKLYNEIEIFFNEYD